MKIFIRDIANSQFEIYLYIIKHTQTQARRRGVTSGFFMPDYVYNYFSKKTIKRLAAKGIIIVGSQAVPMFEGDTFHCGTAWKLVADGSFFIRTATQVIDMANSSWDPKTYLES